MQFTNGRPTVQAHGVCFFTKSHLCIMLTIPSDGTIGLPFRTRCLNLMSPLPVRCLSYTLEFITSLISRHAGHPHRNSWANIGRQFGERFHRNRPHEMNDPESREEPWGTCRAQAVRSASQWSHGILTEHSVQNACERHKHVFDKELADAVRRQ